MLYVFGWVSFLWALSMQRRVQGSLLPIYIVRLKRVACGGERTSFMPWQSPIHQPPGVVPTFKKDRNKAWSFTFCFMLIYVFFTELWMIECLPFLPHLFSISDEIITNKFIFTWSKLTTEKHPILYIFLTLF